jgi:hypothetical protein
VRHRRQKFVFGPIGAFSQFASPFSCRVCGFGGRARAFGGGVQPCVIDRQRGPSRDAGGKAFVFLGEHADL